MMSLQTPRRAFTLIELLCSILVLAVLIGLLLPALRGVREKARTAKGLANLRTHAQTVGSYGADWRGLFPATTRPVPQPTTIQCVSAGISLDVVYFEVTAFWNIPLADQYYSGAWASDVFTDPRVRESLPGRTSYYLSCTTLASPDYYVLSSRRPLPEQLRAVRLAEVQYPSHKGIFVARSNADVWSPDYHRQLAQAATADGGATSVLGKDILAQIMEGEGPNLSYSYHHPSSDPFMHTVQGIHGRDFAVRR
jgi:prepilin-type N-terminal cleavage/methylation domain-containing protein